MILLLIRTIFDCFAMAIGRIEWADEVGSHHRISVSAEEDEELGPETPTYLTQAICLLAL